MTNPTWFQRPSLALGINRSLHELAGLTSPASTLYEAGLLIGQMTDPYRSLFAAAPDMLEVLEAIEGYLMAHFDMHHNGQTPDSDLARLDQIRAAITKATRKVTT